MSDNRPHYTSQEFDDFEEEYQFHHTTSSPYYPESNGQAECMVKTVKHQIKNATDPYLALLSYRATSLPWCGRSLAELSVGRSIHSNIPQSPDILEPQWPHISDFRESDTNLKQ